MEQEFDISKLEFPDIFIQDASTAKAIVDGIQESHLDYWNMIQRMEDHIEGKKPKDPKKLKQKKLGWSNNWNRNKARGKIERLVSENAKDVNDALSLSFINFRRFNEKKDKKTPVLEFLLNDEIRKIIGTKIAQVFIDTVQREQRFTDFMNTTEYNATSWGWCAVTKDNTKDWMGIPHHVKDIGFKGKTRPNEIKTFGVFDIMHGEDLWKKWEKYTMSTKGLKRKTDHEGNVFHSHSASGWIKEGLEEAIFHLFNGKINKGEKPTIHFTEFEHILPEFIQNPSLSILNTDKLKVSKIYHFEKNGDFTVTYVAYQNKWELYKPSADSQEKGCICCSNRGHATQVNPKYLLYQKTYKKPSQDDRIIIIKDSGFSPNGYIQDFRGVAKYAVEDSIRYNRKTNSIEDKLLFSGSPFFREGSAQTGEAIRISPSMGFNLVDENFSLLETQPRLDLQNHLLSLKMDEDDYQRETIHYDPKIGNQLTSRPNKDEVRLKQAELARTASSKSNIKLRSYQRLFFNWLKCLTSLIDKMDDLLDEEVKNGVMFFKEELLHELEAFNITEDEELVSILETVEDLTLEYIIADSSALSQMIALAETPYAKRRLTRMMMLAEGMPRSELSILFPIEDFKNYSDDRVAAIENDMFWTTVEVVYREQDDPVVHLNIHFNKMGNVFDQIRKSSVDPIKGYNYIANLLKHCLFHLGKMNSNVFYQRHFEKYKDIYDKFTRGLNKLKPEIERMAKELAQQQQQQAQQPGIDPKVAHELKMNEVKALAGIQLNEKRSDFRAQEKLRSAEFKREQQEVDFQRKQQREKEKAELDNELKLIEKSIELGVFLENQSKNQTEQQ